MDSFRKVSIYEMINSYLMVGKTHDSRYKITYLFRRKYGLEFLEDDIITEEEYKAKIANF